MGVLHRLAADVKTHFLLQNLFIGHVGMQCTTNNWTSNCRLHGTWNTRRRIGSPHEALKEAAQPLLAQPRV